MRVLVIVLHTTALVVAGVPCYPIGNNASSSLKIHPSSLLCRNHQFTEIFPKSVPLQEADLLPPSLHNLNSIISHPGLQELSNILTPVQSTLLVTCNLDGYLVKSTHPEDPFISGNISSQSPCILLHPCFFAFSYHALSDAAPSFKIHFQYHLP